MIETTPLVRLAILAVVFVVALLLATGLNVDPKRRSLPGWLAWGVLFASFSPKALHELGVFPWGEDGVLVAVMAAFGLYIILPLLFTSALSPESATDAVDGPDVVGTHVQPTTDDYAPGVYRVVGDGDTVTVLYVAGGNGERVSTGTVQHIGSEVFESQFERAADPDGGFHPVRTLRNQFIGLYWSIRKYF